jgi:hypothetical protein
MGVGPLNGKTGEWLRYIGGLILAGLVAYFTAQNTLNLQIASLKSEVAVERTKADERWGVVQSSLDDIKAHLAERDREERQRYNDWLNGINRRTGEPLPLQKAVEGAR